MYWSFYICHLHYHHYFNIANNFDLVSGFFYMATYLFTFSRTYFPHRFPPISQKINKQKKNQIIRCEMIHFAVLVATAKSLRSCPTLCDPIDGSPPGSPVPGILQARTLEWVAISFSNAWKWKVKVNMLSCVWLFTTPWTAAHQVPLPMGFSRQEYWSGVPLPSPLLFLPMTNLLIHIHLLT